MTSSSRNPGPEKVPEMALESAREFARRALDILPGSSVYLFGSQAKGCATERSDIDVAVLCEDLGDLGPAEWRALWRDLLFAADGVDPDIEMHLVSCRHERCGFVDEIVGTGIRIAGPPVGR